MLSIFSCYILDFHKTNPNIQMKKKTLLKNIFHPNMRNRSRSDVKVRKLASKPQLKHNDELESSLSRFRRAVGSGGLRGPCPPPYFGGSVKPFQTRGADFAN